MNVKNCGRKTLKKKLEAFFSKYGWTLDYWDGYETSSEYATFVAPSDWDSVLVRISDHDQKAGGGFNLTTGQRNGEADYSINITRGVEHINEVLAKIATEIPPRAMKIAQQYDQKFPGDEDSGLKYFTAGATA